MYLRYRCRSCTADFVLEVPNPTGILSQQEIYLEYVGRKVGNHHLSARPGCPSIFMNQSNLEVIFDVMGDGPEELEQMEWVSENGNND